jgi:hypothetical protein
MADLKTQRDCLTFSIGVNQEKEEAFYRETEPEFTAIIWMPCYKNWRPGEKDGPRKIDKGLFAEEVGAL